MNFNNFIKKFTSFFTALILLTVITFSQYSQSVFALNGSGSNPLNNMGYRIISDTEICAWIDKNTQGVNKDQFRLFKGSSSKTGIPVNISSATNIIDTAHVASKNTTYQGSSTGGAYTIYVDPADHFIPGQTYTLQVNGTVMANNSHSLGNFSNNKGYEFNFTMPDSITAANPAVNQIIKLNCQEAYTASSDTEPILSSWLTSADQIKSATLERNIWFSFNLPLTKIGDVTLYNSLSGSTNLNNTTNNIANAVKVYKNVGTEATPSWQILGYNPFTNGGTNTQNKVWDKINELGAPIVSDDNTFFSIPTSAGGSAISYNYVPNTTYKVTLPQLTFINGKTISAQEFTFTTAPALPSYDMSTERPSAASDSSVPGSMIISWNNKGAGNAISFTQIGSVAYSNIPYAFAPTGYNIYYSKNKYFDFNLLNTEGPVSPVAGTTTTSYSFNSLAKKLDPGTIYYFRVSSVNNIDPAAQLLNFTATSPSILSGYNESGMSVDCSLVTAPAAPNVTANDTANKIVGIDSTMEYSIDGGTWTKYTSDPDLSGSHTVDVRVAADDITGAPAGAITTLKFTIPEAPAAPAVTADDTANKIVGIDSSMEYSIDGGAWTKYTADPDLSGSHTVDVRVAADAVTGAPAGAVTTLKFTVPAAPAAPNVTADDAANKIVGIDSSMEYSIDGGTWTKYTGNPDLSGNHTVGVRVAAVAATGAPAGKVTVLKFSAEIASEVIPVAAAVAVNPSEPDKADVSISEDQIKKDGINVISPVISPSVTSVATSLSVGAIKNGAGAERIQDRIGDNDIALFLPFNVYNLSSIDNAAKFVVTQSVSSDSAILSAAPSGYKTIGKVFSFSLDVAGNAVHNFAEGKTAVISITLSADDIKGLDTSKLSVYYYDETAGKWAEVGGSYNENTRVFTFTTAHFSSFTVMQKAAVSNIPSALPKTGSPFDLYTLIFISLCFMGAGVYLTVKKESKK